MKKFKCYLIDKGYNIKGEADMDNKHDKGKYKPSLIYTSLLEELSKVRMYGKELHGSFTSWEGVEPIRWLDAAIRHIRAVMDGDILDKDSGIYHLSHAACSIMYAIEKVYMIELKAKLMKEEKTNGD